MNTSSIKEALKKFGFFREYAALIAPLVLAIVAGLLFIPTILMQSKLKAEVQAKSITELGKPAETILKASVISSKQWEVEKKYQDNYQKDAEEIAAMVEMTSRRELLSYVIFPDTNETSVSIYSRFGENYRAGIDKMLADLPARDCPTAAELGSSEPSTQPGTTTKRARLNETEQLIKEALCTEIAQTTSVYMNPESIAGYISWRDFQYQNKKDSIEQCWYWQLGYWIVEDVIKTVKELNYGSSSVFDSPVKRIVSITFSKPSGSSPNTAPATTDAAQSVKPAYITDLKGGLTVPLTARVCSEEFDVVHFHVVAIVRAGDIPFFINKLCSAKEHKFSGFSDDEPEQTLLHNQISVLQTDFGLFEREEGEHELYRYGNDSVVQIELFCEYIFNSKGYEKIKPESVKDAMAANTI